jgi:hypothetical protein
MGFHEAVSWLIKRGSENTKEQKELEEDLHKNSESARTESEKKRGVDV